MAYCKIGLANVGGLSMQGVFFRLRRVTSLKLLKLRVIKSWFVANNL